MKNTENNTPPQTAGAPGSALVAAAQQMDWTQVALNHQYGPPCFCMGKDGRFCGRAQTWAGHPSSHLFVSFADLIGLLEERGNVALDTMIAMSANEPASFDRDKTAYEIARSFYGYYRGDSAGSTEAMNYFAHQWQHLPGLTATVERARALLDALIPQNNQDEHRN